MDTSSTHTKNKNQQFGLTDRRATVSLIEKAVLYIYCAQKVVQCCGLIKPNLGILVNSVKILKPKYS